MDFNNKEELIQHIKDFNNVTYVRNLSNTIIQISTNYVLQTMSEYFSVYLVLNNDKYYLSDCTNTIEDMYFSEELIEIPVGFIIEKLKELGFELKEREIKKEIKIENLEQEIDNFINLIKTIGL